MQLIKSHLKLIAVLKVSILLMICMTLVKYGLYKKEFTNAGPESIRTMYTDATPLPDTENVGCIKPKGYNISSDVFSPDISECTIPRLSHPGLPRMMNFTEYQNIKKLMLDIHRIFTENNITYVMVDGTLLGSYVTHDVLPWDDELDFLIRNSDKKKIVNLLQDTKKYPDHQVVLAKASKWSPERMKMYNVNSPPAGKHTWRWPFADITFIEEDDSRVWAAHALYNFNVERSDFYPLHNRPLFGLWFPAPRNSRLVLRRHYKKVPCHSSTWNHKMEKGQKSTSINCAEMEEFYPVVHRVSYRGGISESLKLKGSEIYTIFVDEPPIGNPSSPFDLM